MSPNSEHCPVCGPGSGCTAHCDEHGHWHCDRPEHEVSRLEQRVADLEHALEDAGPITRLEQNDILRQRLAGYLAGVIFEGATVHALDPDMVPTEAAAVGPGRDDEWLDAYAEEHKSCYQDGQEERHWPLWEGQADYVIEMIRKFPGALPGETEGVVPGPRRPLTGRGLTTHESVELGTAPKADAHRPEGQFPAGERDASGPGDEWRWTVGTGTALPLVLVVDVLAEAVGVLLDEHNYDRHGHEGLRSAQHAAEVYLRGAEPTDDVMAKIFGEHEWPAGDGFYAANTEPRRLSVFRSVDETMAGERARHSSPSNLGEDVASPSGSRSVAREDIPRGSSGCPAGGHEDSGL